MGAKQTTRTADTNTDVTSRLSQLKDAVSEGLGSYGREAGELAEKSLDESMKLSDELQTQLFDATAKQLEMAHTQATFLLDNQRKLFELFRRQAVAVQALQRKSFDEGVARLKSLGGVN